MVGKGSSGDRAHLERFTWPHPGSGKRKCGRDNVRTMLSLPAGCVGSDAVRPWERGQKTMCRLF